MSELDQERLDRQVRIVAAWSRLIFGLLIIWGAVAQIKFDDSDYEKMMKWREKVPEQMEPADETAEGA